MEKNTVWAILLSAIVLGAFMWIQTTYFPTEVATESETPIESVIEEEKNQPNNTTEILSTAIEKADESTEMPLDESDVKEENFTITTDYVKVVFTNRGGDIIDYQLLKHKDGEEFVQMADNINEANRAFSLAFGTEDNSIINEIFNAKIINDPDPTILGDKGIGFYKAFKIKNSDGTESNFILVKEYTFHQDEYLFKLDIHIEPAENYVGINYNNSSYTLRGSPQIGPYWDKSADRYENRTFMSYTDGKQKKKTLGEGKSEIYGNSFTWTGIANKYFVELIVPSDTTTISHSTYSTKIEVDDYANAQVKVTRNPLKTNAANSDTYYIYVGPRTNNTLKKYNSASNNSWGVSNLHLDDALRTSGILTWLEVILKWFMEILYKVIPNWGVSIILMTIIFRIFMFPLTKKQSEGTVKMQELQPQIKELQAKYKDNPKKLNEETAKFYKQTGYNPMSGCLPLLIQFPIIIAMYNLFNNYFDFRGAMFIPGWIPDLSNPDLVATFGFNIPFLGNELHLLPIIYVATQILSMKFTQTQNTAGSSGSSMKIMMYGMPLMFFFIFYNAPAGLLIYWILSNVLMTIQQAIINGFVHGKEKKEEGVAVPKKEVRLPPSAKKMQESKKKAASRKKNKR
ncbi:MAG: membrane protein insertase YidC [Treponema sp. CETP13]|nr:MAG: membrane protein insertase YidC [Treponema sp. CETP13]